MSDLGVVQQFAQGGVRIPPHSGDQLAFQLPPRQQTQPWSPLGSKRSPKCSRETLATLTACCPKDLAVQVSSYRECPSLSVPMVSDRDTDCVRCEQVEVLISPVAELKEEVEKCKNYQGV